MDVATIHLGKIIFILALSCLASADESIPPKLSSPLPRSMGSSPKPSEDLPEPPDDSPSPDEDHLAVSAEKCVIGDREDLIDPNQITDLNFNSQNMICQSQRCLGSDVLHCKVSGWTDEGKPHVECRTDFLPIGFRFSRLAVHCKKVKGCVQKGSCRVEYKLERTPGPSPDNGPGGESGARTGILFMIGICICLLFMSATGGGGSGRFGGFGYPYGGYGYGGFPGGGFGTGLATGGILGYGLGSRSCSSFSGGSFGGGGGGFTSGIGHGCVNFD